MIESVRKELIKNELLKKEFIKKEFLKNIAMHFNIFNKKFTNPRSNFVAP